MKRYSWITLGFIFLVLTGALTSQINTYVNGTILTADQLNAEFGNLYATINNLDQANLGSATAIEPTKISATIDGNGIDRQVDGSLDVQVDGTTVKIVADVVKIVDLPGSAIVAGGIGTTQLAAGSVTKVKLAVKTASATATVGNVGLSTGTGAALITHLTGSMGDLAGNSLTITTNGGPVTIAMVPGTAATNSYIECEDLTTDPCTLELDRGGSTVVKIPFFTSAGTYRVPPGAFSFIDIPAAGTYVYKIKFDVGSATALRLLNVRLMAVEL